MALDIDAPDRVDQGAAGRLDGAALARALLLLAREDSAVEAEAQIVIGRGQDGGKAAGGVEGEPVLPDFERLAGDERGDAAHRIGMPGDDPLLAGKPGGREEGVPVHAGRSGREFGPGPGLDPVRVLSGDGLGMGAGDLVSSAKMRAARPSASGRPISVSIWPI